MTNLIILDNDFGSVIQGHIENSILKPANPDLEREVNVFDVLAISHQKCEARVCLYGGQVLSFKPKNQKEVLWLSKGASYQAGKAIRGGVPLCWPWFGVNDKDVTAQKHGFSRLSTWQLESSQADESGVTIVLSLSGKKQHPLWPNKYKLIQTLFFGENFKQRLAMTNLSSEDAQYSAALHSYLAVSNPSEISLDTLKGVEYYDDLTKTSSIQKLPVNCVGEIDRQYHSDKPMLLVDDLWQRKIELISENCRQWVLWNPGTKLANTMADVHAGGENEYVCLEAGNTHWQLIPAGETITISQVIKVSEL